MAREYFTDNNKMYLIYTPEMGNTENIGKKIFTDDFVLKNTFRFFGEIVNYNEEFESFKLEIGKRKDDYYILNRNVFNIDYDFSIHTSIKPKDKFFICGRTSIIKTIIDISSENIFIVPDSICSNNEGVIPESAFNQLVSSFPNATEIDYYKGKVIESIVGDYFSTPFGYLEKYETYIQKRRFSRDLPLRYNDEDELKISKYSDILMELKRLLKDSTISETTWQKKIAQIVLLLFPKYIQCLQNVRIKGDEEKDRELDFLLIDGNGNADVLEIKKPFEDCILGKSLYRKNYIPKRELSGAIMQSQKYLYYLSIKKEENERIINEKYKDELNGIEVKLINSQALILCGKSSMFDADQRLDFEVIKRNNTNIIDIITYDDLIKRLENTISFLKSKTGEEEVL